MSTAIQDLWPGDIRAEEVLTPEEILRHQAEQLGLRTNGLVVGEVTRAETTDRVILGFEVAALRVSARVRLFEVQHRAEFEYPAAIKPPNDDLPSFLKERYYVTGPLETVGSAATQSLGLKGQWVENEWVADSPMEFTEKVGRVLAMPTVKARVLSLIARSNAPAESESSGGEEQRDGD